MSAFRVSVLRPLALLVCALAIPLVALGQNYFKPAVNYPVGTDPDAVVTADFNHDGYLDLAVSNRSDATVSMLLGNGDGTFRAGVNYPVPGTPENIVVGDFNGDGNPDIVIASSGATTYVSVLLADGKGGLKGPIQTVLPLGFSPGPMATGDFNGDGKLDLVVGAATGGGALVLLGNGDGTFRPPSTLNTSQLQIPTSILVGDFNGDGKPDLAVITFFFASDLGILLGNGDGTFQPPIHYNRPHSTLLAAATGDFNHDGNLDLAVADYNLNGAIEIYLGNGDGTLQPPMRIPTTYSIGLAARDFNGDGKLDLAVSDFSNNVVNILWGNGDGTFRFDPAGYSAGRSSASIVSGDFNGDGKPDLAVGNRSAQSVSVLLNNTPDLPNFKIAAAPNTITVKAGQTATVVVTVSPIGGFNSPIDLSCSGLPASMSCAFLPTRVTPNGVPVVAVLQIATQGTAQLRNPLPLRKPGSLSASGYGMLSLGFISVVLAGSREKSKRRKRVALIILLSFLALWMSACGGLAKGPFSNTAGNNLAAGNSAPGSYQVVVTGQAVSGGAMSRQAVINLAVN